MEKGQNLSDFDFGKVLALYEVRDFILANMPHFIGRRWAKKLEAHCERLQSNIKNAADAAPAE